MLVQKMLHELYAGIEMSIAKCVSRVSRQFLWRWTTTFKLLRTGIRASYLQVAFSRDECKTIYAYNYTVCRNLKIFLCNICIQRWNRSRLSGIRFAENAEKEKLLTEVLQLVTRNGLPADILKYQGRFLGLQSLKD